MGESDALIITNDYGRWNLRRHPQHGYLHVWPPPDRLFLEDFYRNRFHNPTYSFHDELHVSLLRAQRPELFDRHGKILEIGCGDGRKLAVFHRLGFSCFGFEPSSRDLEVAANHGFPVSPQMFDEEVALRWGPFDYLFLSNVLEHVPDPEGLLLAVRPLLAPDGQLLINVPNDMNALQTVYLENSGQKAWFIDPPEHLSYFSSETLTRLCEAAGFEVERKTTRFPMEMFLLMGDDYVVDPPKGRLCHQRRVAFERSFMQGRELVLWSFYDGLASRGFGRELIFLCRPSASTELIKSPGEAS